MMINLHKIFTICGWRNTNSKYFNKICQYVRISISSATAGENFV